MINSQQVKHGGVKIPDVDGVFYDIVAEVVRLSVVQERDFGKIRVWGTLGWMGARCQ